MEETKKEEETNGTLPHQPVNQLSAADLAAVEENKTELSLPPAIEMKDGGGGGRHRPDIDLLRIALTWEILFFHCVLPYVPIGFNVIHPVSQTLDGWMVGFLYVIFMDNWHMCAFFFLAGVSAHLSLGRRTERQYRDERVHRLLTPTLFLMAVTNLLYIPAYWAPLSDGCVERHFNGNMSGDCKMWLWRRRGDTLGTFTTRIFSIEGFYMPNSVQAWFCIYLFAYAQLFAFQFMAWHPAHSRKDRPAPTCCGSSCIRKPYKLATKIFCCFYSGCCRSMASPDEVAEVGRSWAASKLKILLYPGLILAVSEATLRQVSANGNFNIISVFFDFANTVRFITVYVFGYLVTAYDDVGAKEAIHKMRYGNFVVGVILIAANTGLVLNYNPICGEDQLCHIGISVVRGLCSGQGTWMIILGLYGLARSLLTTNYSWLPTLRKMAMPFYLTHMQIMTPILAGAMWVPYLRSFPVVLVLCTLATGLASYLITRSGSFMYFFGLQPPPGSWLPGKAMRGFVPVLVLVAVLVLEAILAGVMREVVWGVTY